MSTLITKLFRKNRILIICPLVSDCTNGVTSVFLTLSGSNLVERCNRSQYTSLQTHSKTSQYYDIGCRRHGICDHGSMSTLITKLFRKNRILTICPLVSDCTIGRNICFPYTIWLKSRRKTQPLPVYVSAKFNIDIFHCKQDIVLGIFHIRSNNCLANERFFD